MADARRVGHHVHETNALSFGHHGTATYDVRRHEWTFLRRHQTQDAEDRQRTQASWNHSSHFLLVDERTWNSAPDSVQAREKAQDSRLGRGLQNLFLKRVPDAALLAVDLPSQSNTTASQSEKLNRPSESVLALGHARPSLDSRLHNDAPYTPIVAFRACSNNGILLLLAIEERQVAIRNEAGLLNLCTVPFIGNVLGHWAESTDEILHISSASHVKGTQFLVVKPSGTTILRPTLSKHKVPEVLLDPCPVVTIPCSRTGAEPHAHAIFNPQDRSRVVIVDTGGQWSVWKVTGRISRSARILHQVSLQGSNHISSSGQQSLFSGISTYRDKWHRACWLTNPKGVMDRLLVCNRRVAAAFDQTGSFLGQVDMRLGSLSDRNLILDVKISDRRSDLIFVLTTSRFLIFSSSQSTWRMRNPKEALELVCSWNHYRDRTDLGLRMGVFETLQDSWVLLYSATSHFAVLYQFEQEDSSSTTVAIRDPSTFQLPQHLTERMRDVTDIIMCPVAFSTQDRALAAGGFGLIKLIACLATGEVIEALYKHELEQFGLSGHLPNKFREKVPHLSLPRTLDKLLNTHPLSSEYVVDDGSDEDLDEDLDDFVIADDGETKYLTSEASAAHVTSQDVQPVPFSSRNWRGLLRYETLMEKDNDGMSFRSTLQQAIEHLERLKDEDTVTPIHLISDLVDRCRITDVEEDSQIATLWLDTLAPQASITVEPAASAVGGFPSASHRHLLLDLYESLVRVYVESLSGQVTDRGRVNRERLVRQIVGDSFLGAFVLISENLSHPSDSPLPYSTRTRDGEVPSPSLGLQSDDQEFSQAPTPETLPDAEEPAVTRLRKYATFHREVPPLLLDHHANISNILAHLPDTIQQNPADYSYQQTNQKIKFTQKEIAAESLNTKERKKALKSAARLERKLEKTQLISQEVMMRRNLLPGISSRPKVSDLPEREVQSSQPAAPSSSQTTGLPGLSMTQPERGAYGTRQAEKKGKKGTKRQAGF
ncbi:uncharacterized protein Z519_08208 [Cladophialophora bantiana CBS 173.52]|uniref:RNA polymerase I-specific transcription initiation factor RRN6-like protein n=1 Tax=Cladophialophora bantiana (strain ATCC 10958 / CBS 173.52 / CDC B-1940 / NIH 8579) TaxID=1442370 RepID=A0A0D2FXV9_CLAB1|nr:uncharacterized protein Z519_08208 [Cladophialophora bantiana CBS 173.52]KIW91312.1 hypothetical protein Z519_08208 [Cladophialophora bantiana CBS 173.52]